MNQNSDHGGFAPCPQQLAWEVAFVSEMEGAPCHRPCKPNNTGPVAWGPTLKLSLWEPDSVSAWQPLGYCFWITNRPLRALEGQTFWWQSWGFWPYLHPLDYVQHQPCWIKSVSEAASCMLYATNDELINNWETNRVKTWLILLHLSNQSRIDVASGQCVHVISVEKHPRLGHN